MQEALSLVILVCGGIAAALAASAVMAGTVQLTSRRVHGYLHLIFYAMVMLVALSTLLSGRDLSFVSLTFEEPRATARHPIMQWVQPLTSLLMLMAAGERILSYWLRRERAASAPTGLLLAFIIFWLGTVAAPAFLGAHPFVSHDYAYPLILGSAALLATAVERDMAFKAARDALMLFMLVGLLLIPIQPGLVLDSSYSQGLLPGIPRLGGLAAHAVSMSVLAQLGLICLMAFPYTRIWLNRLAWAVGLTVLFLAQSKTGWVSFILCATCFWAVQKGPNFSRQLSDHRRPAFGVLAIVAVMLVVLALGLVLMFGDVGARMDHFFNSPEGAQLASLTGRDKIWAIAYEEWRRNPVFGYGPLIWEADFRISIAMPNATHAHNQFMDTLSRSGSVGAAALVLYVVTLLVLSIRYVRQSKGLTLALFTLLAIRSVSEVPLLLLGYSPEFITHLLLLMAIAALANDSRVQKSPTATRTRNYRAAYSPSARAAGTLGTTRTGA